MSIMCKCVHYNLQLGIVIDGITIPQLKTNMSLVRIGGQN